MNTAEFYIEPVLIGALTLALFAFPFAPELMDVARSDIRMPFGDVSLGATLVGIAYFVGILVDRLIDTCLQAIERHGRVRFALGSLKVPEGVCESTSVGRRTAWEARPDPNGDLFPEDTYRWLAFTQAERIAGSLDYIRSRIRLIRAMAFLLPGLLFACTIGTARLVWSAQCSAPAVQTAQCNQPDWMAALLADVSWFLYLAPCLYAAAIGAAMALNAADARRWRIREERPHKHLPGSWRRAGLWSPPHTRSSLRMQWYAEARDWPIGDSANRNLWLDILAQPAVWCLILLLLASIPAIMWLVPSLPGLMLSILAGALLTFSAGWAWWRITRTYMDYLRSSGEFLKKQASSTHNDRKKDCLSRRH